MSIEKYVQIDFLVEDETYSVIENQVICPICYEINLNPKMCINCQNTFCGKCAETLKSCPFKCETFNCIDSRLTKELLSKLSFRCVNGCDKLIKFDDIKNHYESECEKINFKEKYEKSKEIIVKLEQEIKKLKGQKQDKFEEINQLKQENKVLNDGNLNLSSLIQQIDCIPQIHPIKRAPILREVKSAFHPHKLIYKGNDYPCLCDICQKAFPKFTSFNCKLCKFDLCDDCIDYPNTAIVKDSTFHRHVLIYGENTDSCQCIKCGNTIKKQEAYCCRECEKNYCQNCMGTTCNIF